MFSYSVSIIYLCLDDLKSTKSILETSNITWKTFKTSELGLKVVLILNSKMECTYTLTSIVHNIYAETYSIFIIMKVI